MKAARDCIDVMAKINYPPERLRLTVNRTAPGGLSLDTVRSFFRREPDAVIDYSDLFDLAVDAGRPLVTFSPDSPAAHEVRRLAQVLEDAVYEGPKV